MFCYVDRAARTHTHTRRERRRKLELRVKHRRTTAKIIMAWNVHGVCVCVCACDIFHYLLQHAMTMTMAVTIPSLLWALWGFHFYSIGLNTHWLRVRKPKNFVKSSHSSIIIRVLSVTCTFWIHVCVSLRVWVWVNTHSVSIKSHETQIFLQDVCGTCTEHTYAVLPFIGSTPTSIGMTEIASFFPQKNHITRIISHFIEFNLMKPNPILMRTHTHKKSRWKEYTNLCVTVWLSITAA